jgi:hypothetical protein
VIGCAALLVPVLGGKEGGLMASPRPLHYGVSPCLHNVFFVSFDSSEVPTHTEHVHLLFRFSHLSVASLLCEWSWAIRLSAAIFVAPDSKKALHLSYSTGLIYNTTLRSLYRKMVRNFVNK